MLSFPLRRAQIELQAHRNWLKTFVVQANVHGEAHWSAVRSFSAVHRDGQEQEQDAKRKEWNPIARARAKADADQRRREVKDAEAAAAEPGTRLSDAQRRKRERWQGRRSAPQTIELKALGLREDLMSAVQKYDSEAVFRLYGALPERRPLAAEDLRAIAQCTHQALRKENQRPPELQSADAKQAIITFADLLAKDIRRGNVVPSRPAHTHLIGIYKESGFLDAGAKFWQWLEPQDDTHVGTDTYAAAIELLAIHGSPLEDLESLYTKALTRFPSNFSSYHLAPNSIVSDRDAETKIKGLPISLLQAITTARLLRGNTRQAYLALDTVFRLYPTAVDSRFIKGFLDERPISEAYTVFAMACRAGLTLPTAITRNLVSRIRTAAEEDATSAQHHVLSLRVISAVLRLHLGATGKIIPNSIAEMIIATTSIFRRPGIDKLGDKQRKELVDAVLLSVRRIIDGFARFGFLPSTAALNSILINVAGHGRSTETLGIVLNDLDTLKLTPTDVTRRTILAVSGMWKDQSMIEKSWDKIIEARRAKNEWPDSTDFFVLSKAVRATGRADYAQKQFDTLKMFIPESRHASIEYAVLNASKEEDGSASGDTPNFEYLHQQVQKLNDDLAVLESETRSKPAVFDFSIQKAPTALLPPDGALRASNEVERQVYDEMTTEPSAASLDALTPDVTNAVSSPVRSATNIRLGDLRFESWRDINYLLQLSERHDTAYGEIVDRCIATGEKPPPKNMGFTQKELRGMESFGRIETAEGQEKSTATVEEFRAEVQRLRMV